MLRFNTAQRNLIVDAITDEYNAGFLDVHEGPQPNNPNGGAPGLLLATIELPTPAFAFANDGVATLLGVWATTALAAGTAGWARMRNATGTVRMDLSIGDVGEADMVLDHTELIQGESVVVQSFVITYP